MSAELSFGIASFAHHHAHHWARAALAAPEATLVGIWDDDEERGRRAAGRYGVPFHRRLEDLAGHCDAVGVTSETSKHADHVEVCAAAGAHVLCEKPLAVDLDGCRRIEVAVQQAGVVFMMNFPKRLDPASVRLREVVASGELGEVTLARVRHGHGHGNDEKFRTAWFQDPALSGGGTLIDEGVHAADFLRWLLGEPLWVWATTSSDRLGLEVDDTALAAFVYPDGVIGEICTSWCFHAGQASVEVFGTQGTALLSGVDLASRDHARPPYLQVATKDQAGGWKGDGVVPAFLGGGFHEQGPRSFFRCLVEGLPPPTTVHDGARSLAMVLGAYQSAHQGARIAL